MRDAVKKSGGNKSALAGVLGLAGNLPNHFFDSLVFAKAQIARMAQLAVPRSLRKHELADQLRFDPAGVARQTASSLEEGSFDLKGPELFAKLRKRFLGKAGLRRLGLVVGEREGRSVLYALHDEHVGLLLEEAMSHVEYLRLGLADHRHDKAVGVS